MESRPAVRGPVWRLHLRPLHRPGPHRCAAARHRPRRPALDQL